MNTCNRIRITCHGDPSVGIPPISAELAGDGDFIFDAQWDEEEIENFRRDLAFAFAGLWDGAVNVQFDYELKAELEAPEEGPPA